MNTYRYRAVATGGTIVSGVLEAADQSSAIERVRELGQYPISATLAPTNSLAWLTAAFALSRQISHRRLSLAIQELATLLKSGLDLDRALGILERLGDLGALQERFAAVRARVVDGASLADALDAEPAFPKFVVSTVRAGEFGGTLEETLGRLSEYLARSVAVREAVASALLYPIVLMVTAGLSIICILVFVLPEFRPLFAEAGKAMPWSARAIMAAGDFVRGFWWAIALVGLLSLLTIHRLLQRPRMRSRLDRQLLSLPILGRLLAAIDIERFSRTLGTLLSNGVPLPNALPIAKGVIANRILAAAVEDSATGLREGDGFAERVGRTGAFPAVTVDLIRVGEETGKLDEMLLRQADLDEQRIRHTIDRLLALLVPALTIVLGLLVGGLIATLLSAILSVNSLALPS